MPASRRTERRLSLPPVSRGDFLRGGWVSIPTPKTTADATSLLAQAVAVAAVAYSAVEEEGPAQDSSRAKVAETRDSQAVATALIDRAVAAAAAQTTAADHLRADILAVQVASIALTEAPAGAATIVAAAEQRAWSAVAVASAVATAAAQAAIVASAAAIDFETEVVHAAGGVRLGPAETAGPRLVETGLRAAETATAARDAAADIADVLDDEQVPVAEQQAASAPAFSMMTEA